MARRVHTADDFVGVGAWWSSIPPVTRTLGTMWIGAAVALKLGLFPFQHLYLDFYLIFRRGQIWRLLTHVSVLGGFSLPFAMHLMWLFIYAPPLERSWSEVDPGEFAFLILFSHIGFTLVGLLNPFTKIAFSATPMVYTLLYVWSREFSSQVINIYGIIPIKAFYLPWAMLAISMIFGASTSALLIDLTGIAVGHLFYFLRTIYPAQTGQSLLKCPFWLTRFMAKYYKKAPAQQPGMFPFLTLLDFFSCHLLGTSNEATGAGTGGGGGGFTAFSGRAHRLQD